MVATDCDWLFDIRGEFVQKIEKANESVDALARNVQRAMYTLAGAEAAAVSCLLLGPTPAAAICGVTAGIAIAVAYAHLQTYEAELEEAQRALQEAQDSIERVDELLMHCRALEPWQDEARDELIGQAPDPDSIIIPDVDDGPIDEAEDLLASLEVPAYEDAYA